MTMMFVLSVRGTSLQHQQ